MYTPKRIKLATEYDKQYRYWMTRYFKLAQIRLCAYHDNPTEYNKQRYESVKYHAARTMQLVGLCYIVYEDIS